MWNTTLRKSPFFVLFFTLSALVIGCRPDDYLFYDRNPPQEQARDVQVRQMIQKDQLDILWVIDNSASMRAPQNGVIQNAIKIFEGLSQKPISWKMGLISTDDREGPYIGFTPQTLLNEKVPTGLADFRSALGRLGLSGSTVEKAFSPMRKAFDNHPTFLRPNSILATVIITDTLEGGSEPTNDFINYLKTKKSAEKTRFYGVLSPRDWGCTNTGDTAYDYAGSRYEQLINAYPGSKTYSLCQGDFSGMLEDIARDLMNQTDSPWIYLETRPEPSTIQVYHRGILIPGGPPDRGGAWHYDPTNNALVFHDLSFAPEDNEEVRIVFEPAGRVRD